MQWLEDWLGRPVAVVAWAVALLLAGAWAATRVPLEWVPQVELPEVRVHAGWPGASPRQVERYVTAPLERAVQRVPGTEHVESLSQEGQATVTLGVAEATDLGAYVAQVNEQLALLRGALPDRVTPRLTKQVPEALRDEQGFMTLQLIGPTTPNVLRTLADDQVAPRLRSLSGVADVVVEGGTRRELLVTLDPDRLDAYRIDPGAIRRVLREATADAVYGRLRGQGRAVVLFSPAEADVAAFRRLVARPPASGQQAVRLADVARVQLGPAPVRSISRIDGQAVVTLTVDRARGSHLLAVAHAVRARIEAVRPTLPDGTRLLVADDKSEDVRAQLRDLSWRGGLGLLLVVLVLLFMLRSVRATGIALFSVAVALAVALAGLGPLGLTLNLLTLAGLVLVFGLLVDNSVVMVEQLVRWRSRLRGRGVKGRPLQVQSTTRALRAVWLPLLGSTLSTMAVMLPLVYLSGELRTLFLPFGVLVGLTLLASLASAALLVPVLGRFLPPPEPERRWPRWLRRMRDAPYRWVARVPRLSLAVLVLALGVPFWLLPDQLEEPDAGWSNPARRLAQVYNATLGSEAVQEARAVLDPALGGVFRPFIRTTTFGQRWDFKTRPEVYVSLRFPPGNPIERADSLMQRFERTALASASVARTLVRVSERAASMRVRFTEATLKTAEPYLVRERLIQEAVLLAGIDVSVSGLLPQGYSSVSGMGISGQRVEAYGPNYEDLEALCERFARRLQEQSRRVVAVNTNAGRFGRSETREVLRFRWDAEAQARAGAPATRLAARLRPVLATRFPVLYADLEGETHLPVRVVVEGADQTDVAQLVEQPLRLDDSTQVKLASLVDATVEEVPSAIERADQQYKRYLRVDYRGPYRMGSELIESTLASFQTPPGYRLEQGGYAFFGDEAVRSAFGWVLLGTLGLVFLVTAAVFESWRLPLVVMLSVPMAGVGVALGFLWSGASFAEGAFIGVVLLVGIAVNDSLLLVDRYRQLRQRRPATAPALLVRLAVRERLRPMWTTTLTSVVAMFPLLVFPNGSDFWTGLAVTVTGGLLAATLLAPLATVALLSMRSAVARGA